jgi:predicted acyl esterase
MNRIASLLLICLPLLGYTQPDWTEISIPMSDGEELAADVYLPADDGTAYPVIFIQTPYNKNLYHLGLPLGVGWNQEDSDYAFVIMDWRCYWGSLGACNGLSDNGQDGYDAVEWIADQDWCTGKIGTYGPSALGNVQYKTAEMQPPHLTCCVPEVAAPYLFYEHYFPGGCARTEYIQTLGVLFGIDELYAANPYHNLVWQVVENNTWSPPSINTPFLLIGGWYDINIRDQFILYEGLKNEAESADETWMLIGPWVHGGSGPANVGSLQQGELEYPDAEHGNREMAMAFFDYYLRDIDNDWEETENITYYQLGDDEWLSTNNWPPEGWNMTLYLQSDGNMGESPGDDGPESLMYSYDPTDPSPTVGGHVLSLDQGPYDQVPDVESRNDILVFTSDESLTDFTVNGKVTAHLSVSSDQIDTDFIVRMTDLYPDGRSMLISSSVQRMRFLNGFTASDEAFITPGQIYNIEVELPDIAHHFMDGHRLRIDISSSNHPHFNRNMNNGTEMYPNLNLDTLAQVVVAQNSIHLLSPNLSFIEVPVVDQAVGIEDQVSSKINLAPNPASENLIISGLPLVPASLSIYDSQGILVHKNSCSSASKTLSISNLKPGLYQLMIQAGEFQKIKSFVKE